MLIKTLLNLLINNPLLNNNIHDSNLTQQIYCNKFFQMGNSECCRDIQQYNPPLKHIHDNPETNQYSFQPSIWPADDIVINSILQQSQYKQEPVYKRKDIDLYYTGQTLNNNIPDGKGLMYYQNKFLYEGHFVNGQADGQGKATLYQKQSTYEGQFCNSRAQGKGVFKNKLHKYQFSGQWYESKPLKGTISFEYNNTTIQIDYSQNDEVTIYYANGDVYKGQVDTLTYLPEGKGSFFTKDGKKSYSGKWSKGTMNGYGKFQWKQNNRTVESYEGDFKDGKKKGIGKYCFESGNVYEGEFVNDQRNGFGKLIDSNGHILMEGQWMDQKLIKQLDNVSALINQKKLSIIPQRDSQYKPNSGRKMKQNEQKLNLIHDQEQQRLFMQQQNFTKKKQSHQIAHNYQIKQDERYQNPYNELKTNIKQEESKKIHQDTPFPGFHYQYTANRS